MKPILTTMTALAVVLASFPAAEAGKMSNMNFKPKPQVLKIKPPRIQVHRRLAKPARVLRKNDSPPSNEAGPQPEPPTRPKRTKTTNFAKPAPLPKPRPYNEFDEGSDAAGIGDAGPATELPEDGELFDQNLIAGLPETWGHFSIDILAGLDRGAIDGALDNPPDPVGPFPPGDNGLDLTGMNPGDHIQPGGPNDPEAGDSMPEFLDDPRGPEGGNQDQGMTNPSNAISDPRGMASEGDLPDRTQTAATGDYIGEYVDPDNGNTTTEYGTEGAIITYTEWLNKEGELIGQTATRATFFPGMRVVSHFKQNSSGDFERTNVVIENSPYSPDSNPNPEGGWGEGIDVAMCGSTIPMWVCMRGASGSASPGDMLTQPSETGSIMGSGDGPDLGAEAVTNTGDASWNTTDSRGNGSGGGGGESDDARQPDPPRDPTGG